MRTHALHSYSHTYSHRRDPAHRPDQLHAPTPIALPRTRPGALDTSHTVLRHGLFPTDICILEEEGMLGRPGGCRRHFGGDK